MFGNNAPGGAEILALLGMRPTTKHAPTLARPKVKFAKPRFVPTGSISAPDPTIRNSIQQTLAGVLSKAINERQAHRLASRAMAPLTDATPLGNVTGAEEGGKQFYRGLTKGDARTAGLGALSFGLSVLPVPGGVKKAARKTGLFGSLMKDETGAIRAWHGSPHDFDRFDMSKIGTGEGAQAYGHGLYFAESPEVARHYQGLAENLRAQWQGPHRGVAQDLNLGLPFAEAKRQRLASLRGNKLVGKDELAAEVARVKALKLDDFEYIQPSGRLYEVNINAEPEDFLDWDRPIGEQSIGQSISKALSPEELRVLTATEAKGQDLQHFLTNRARGEYGSGNPVFATDALRQSGIPGIRYLDQGSRGGGNGTRNYVVFDDSLIDILNKF